jgi:hypothetical protein
MTLKLPPKVSHEVAAGVSELYLRFNCDYCQEVQNYLRFLFSDITLTHDEVYRTNLEIWQSNYTNMLTFFQD